MPLAGYKWNFFIDCKVAGLFVIVSKYAGQIRRKGSWTDLLIFIDCKVAGIFVIVSKYVLVGSGEKDRGQTYLFII